MDESPWVGAPAQTGGNGEGPEAEAAQPQSAEPPAGPRRKKSARRGCLYALSVVLTVPLIFFGAALYGWHWMNEWSVRPEGTPGAHRVVIARGSSTPQIASQLAAQGLLRYPQLFPYWKRFCHPKATLQAGDFTLEGPVSPEDLVEKLAHGQFGRAVTIPEGWTSRQIAQRLAKEKLIANPQAWLDAVARPVPADVLGEAQPDAEGFCFPDTYHINPGASAGTILSMMLDRFSEQWRQIAGTSQTLATIGPARLSLRQAVTLASMLEREARIHEEMPLISSVYYNRLARNMKLQCCATVYYSLGLASGEERWNQPLRLIDLKVNSPYNTYLNPGLPPGPICNPGRAALGAAAKPEHSEFLFYVYRGQRRHIFSRTYEDHKAAIASIRDKNPQAAMLAQ